MACNVYLTFFRKYDQRQLRALEWKYMLFCYGVPAIPAIVFLFIQTEKKGKVYGPAVVCGNPSSPDVKRALANPLLPDD